MGGARVRFPSAQPDTGGLKGGGKREDGMLCLANQSSSAAQGIIPYGSVGALTEPTQVITRQIPGQAPELLLSHCCPNPAGRRDTEVSLLL